MPRYLLPAIYLLSACGDNLAPDDLGDPAGSPASSSEEDDSPPRDDDPKPDPHPDAGSPPEPDACDPPVGGGTLFESALFQSPTALGLEVSIIQMIGVRFTTTETRTITGLGAYLSKQTGSAQIFVAVVPLEANGYPASETLENAIGFGSGTVEGPGRDYVFATSFTLPPGTYGLIAGSGRLGVANNEASMPTDNDAVGAPDMFMWQGEGPNWAEAQVSTDPVRLFVVGN